MEDTFLARWLADELDSEELSAFEKSPDFAAYRRIRDTSDGLLFPDFSEADALKAFRLRAAEKPNTAPVTAPMRSVWVRRLAIAATTVGLVLVAANFWYSPATQIVAAAGEHRSFWLPDSSRVVVNAGSSATFYARHWDTKREITLVGEAFFEVKKGQDFIVNTQKGAIQVLGTRFNVSSWGSLEVACYEGKVGVKANPNAPQMSTLVAGERLRFSENTPMPTEKTTADGPTWVSGVSQFTGAPLRDILQEMERQFGVELQLQNTALANKTYSLDVPQADFATARLVIERLIGVTFTEQSAGKWVVK